LADALAERAAARERLLDRLRLGEACRAHAVRCRGGQRGGQAGRGGGAAALTREARVPTPAGAPQVLDAAVVEPDGSVAFATAVRDPTDEDIAAAARAATQAFDPAAADARRAVVAPGHRAATARYFQAATAEDPAP
jgi:hypothetical protein